MTTLGVSTHIPPVIGFRQQFDAYYRGEVEKLKTRLKTTINTVLLNREDLENPIYLALKERAKYQFFKRVDPTRSELDIIKDLRPFAETMLDLLAQLLRFQFDGNLFKEKKIALEKHIEKERSANKLKDDSHLLNLTSAFFSHLDHIRVLGNINTHENRMKEETFVEYMMATLGALRMVTIFLDLLESTGFKLLAQISREKNLPKIQMTVQTTKLPYQTPTPNIYDQYATPIPHITPQSMYKESLPTPKTTLEQQMELQQLLATMFPANQKMTNTATLPNIRHPTNIYAPTNITTNTPSQPNHSSSQSRYEAALQSQPDQIEDFNQAYYNEQMYNAHFNQQAYPAPHLPPSEPVKPLTMTPTITQQSPQYIPPTYTTQNVYPSRNTHLNTASNIAIDPSNGFQALSSTIRIKPALTLDQAEFLKTEEDFEWKTIDFKREFCFLHFADGEAASRALNYFDCIKQIPEYSFLRHYDASMYLKPQAKDEKRKY